MKLNFDDFLYSSKQNIISAYIRIIILSLILYFFKIIDDEDKKIFISISHANSYRKKELAVHIPRFSTFLHFLKEIRKNSLNNFHFKAEKW